jgi:rhamnogalacturonan acetylesterase
MKFTSFLAALAFGALQASAAPTSESEVETRQANPTVHFCGDSTMARSSDGQTDGWGQYINKYLTVPVINYAIGGRSARSYWNEGRFQTVANAVRSGDIVVIEFGHNDGGSPNSNDNGRSDCPGAGTETCISDKTGEVVYTFVFYVIQAARLMTAKGATVILSSQTPNNQWEGGSYNGSPSRFVGYQLTAKNALATSAVTYVDHFAAVSSAYQRLGSSYVNGLYPNDHTHTSPVGADLSAKEFARAISTGLNGNTPLKPYVKGL